MKTRALRLLVFVAASAVAWAEPLPGTQPLAPADDPSGMMVAGIDRWLQAATLRAAQDRATTWQAAANSDTTWPSFAARQRGQLMRIIGAEDLRESGLMEEVRLAGAATAAIVGPGFEAVAVRWPVFAGVHGEGVLFRPTHAPRGVIIILPDADDLPEHAPRATELAAQGWLVLAPVLVDRRSTWSGSVALNRFTNQPHREWLHRPAFEMGRTVVGYEVQKILAAIDALRATGSRFREPAQHLGLMGHGEGGLLALVCTALDERIAAAVVSGYFGPREGLAAEPLYRNVFGWLRDFGDAELVALAAPRPIFVEARPAPSITGQPPGDAARRGAAPGAITTPGDRELNVETARADALLTALKLEPLKIFRDSRMAPPTAEPDAQSALLNVLQAAPLEKSAELATIDPRKLFAAHATEEFVDARQQRTVRELEKFTQSLVPKAERMRHETFWSKVKPGDDWPAAQQALRERLWREVIGKIDVPLSSPNPRTRLLFEKEKWSAYEVTLDVLPEVFAWGWLLVPRDLKPGERRPVVVCQHGLEGLPEDVVNDDPKTRAYAAYKAFGAQLVERGFIVYAPHNPYRGGDRFRLLQRRANPLGLSLFSFILAQHDVTTQWLASLPFVDPQRIAFYGLSYGGKTAMRVPALLDRYCLSICSGDFNEWVLKNVSTDFRGSYVFTGEWEMPEWNLAFVANYAEMAMLIAPRPFMVERGHDDGVASDEWVAYEYAKVRRGYTKLGIPERTEIEWFNGPHTIHGVGTFEFLHRHLAWPLPE